MANFSRQSHWQNVYRTKSATEVSWFEDVPSVSLALIEAARLQKDAAIIDVGAGASRLVDALVAQGYEDVTALDISEIALSAVRSRLGAQAGAVRYIVADVTEWNPSRAYAMWHDRATFHFLTDRGDRAAYVERLRRAVQPGGQVIIGTFAPDGPERCSGLPVARYDAASLAEVIGSDFELLELRMYNHPTPAGASQHFCFSRFRRSGRA